MRPHAACTDLIVPECLHELRQIECNLLGITGMEASQGIVPGGDETDNRISLDRIKGFSATRAGRGGRA